MLKLSFLSVKAYLFITYLIAFTKKIYLIKQPKSCIFIQKEEIIYTQSCINIQ